MRKAWTMSLPLGPAPAPPLDEPHQRLRFAREQAGYASASDAARAMGVEEPTYLGHENGSRGLSRAGARYARFFRVSLDWLIGGRGDYRMSGGEAQFATALRSPAPSLAGLADDSS